MIRFLRHVGIITPGKRVALQTKYGRMILVSNDGLPVPGYVKGEYLKRVLPLAKPCDTERGRITFLSLEMYEDGSIIPYQAVAASPYERDLSVDRTSRRFWDQEWLAKHGTKEDIDNFLLECGGPFGSCLEVKIEDDIGTNYNSLATSSGGDGRITRGELRFTPPVTDTAKKLTMSVYEREWRWEVDHASGRLPEDPSCTLEVTL